MPTTWRDGTSTPRIISQLEGEIPFTNVKWPAYGAVGNGVADDTAAVQAVFNTIGAQGGGAIFFPPGVYKMSAGLTLPAGVSLLGAGIEGSWLSWPTDLGASVWALRPAGALGTYNNNTIEGLSFHGESYGTALVMGTAGTNQRGLLTGRHMTLRKINVSGFYYGVGISEDHLQAYDCDLNNNHANIAWVNGAPSFGNVTLEDIRADGASLAGILVENGNSISDSQLVRVTNGRAPWGILSASGRATTNFIVNTLLDQVNAESVGNGFINGQNTTDLIANAEIVGCNGSLDATFRLPSTTYDAWARCGQWSGVRYDGATAFPDTSVPTLAPFYASNTGLGFGNCHFYNIGSPYFDFCETNSKPMFKDATGVPINLTFSSREGRGVVIDTQAAAALGDLMQLNTAWIGAPSSGGVVPLGIARNSAAINLLVPVITDGRVQARTDATGFSGLKLIKRSATTGRLTEATGWTDGPILGVADSAGAVAANALFQMHVRLGSWGGG